jgi:hypothetical protein
MISQQQVAIQDLATGACMPNQSARARRPKVALTRRHLLFPAIGEDGEIGWMAVSARLIPKKEST